MEDLYKLLKKRGPRPRFTELERKNRRKIVQKRANKKRVHLGSEHERWESLRSELSVSNCELAKRLLDAYEVVQSAFSEGLATMSREVCMEYERETVSETPATPQLVPSMTIGEKRKPPGFVFTKLTASGKTRKCIVHLPSLENSEPPLSSDETRSNSGAGVRTNEDNCRAAAFKQMPVTDLSNAPSNCGNAHSENGEECYVKQEVIQDFADEPEDVGFLPIVGNIFIPTNFELQCEDDVMEDGAMGSGTDESIVNEKPSKSAAC